MGAVMPNAREPGRRLVRGRVDAYLQGGAHGHIARFAVTAAE
jgi:hypothetical protein